MDPKSSRRSCGPITLVVMYALGVAATFWLPPSTLSTTAQGIKRGMPTPPDSAQKNSDQTEAPHPNRAAKRAKLIHDEKEFRDGVERLYQLTIELRKEVQQTPTAAVVSVPMIKKTEAIEKLAKQLKNKAKGS